MTNRRDLLKLAGLLATNAATPSFAQTRNVIPYGTTLYGDVFNSQPEFRAAVLAFCQEVQPDNTLSLYETRVTPDEFQTRKFDVNNRMAQSNGLKMRGHALIWGGNPPKWVNSITSPLDMERVITRQIEQVMTKYKGQIYAYHVVNEPISYAPKHTKDLFDCAYNRILGEKYIDIAYKRAKEIDPAAKLSLCEDGLFYGTEQFKIKREAFENLVFRLLDRGVPIKEIALQGHLSGPHNFDNEGFSKMLEKFKKAGLEIAVTEMDVIEKSYPTDIAIRDMMVAAKTYEFLKIITDVVRPNCIHTWGITDKYTWLGMWWKRDDKTPIRGLPLDEFYKPKPMMQVIQHFCKNGKS
jgi:endo-1,4-beta-xylanase